jgi:5-methylcytosine-specific restriction endonuclease McrA
MASFLEKMVWQRAGRACEYCQMPQECDELTFEIDHIIASKHGGPTTAQNLALACFACNHHKGPNIAGRDPKTGRITRLFHPRRHKWNRHFR